VKFAQQKHYRAQQNQDDSGGDEDAS
jgi:hypothetical protein